MSKRPGAVSAETKEKILQAAREEFSLRGFTGSSLRRICSAAGVTTGAVYFFFDGKDDLFETVIREVTGPFMQFVRSHYGQERQNISADRSPGKGEIEDINVVARLIDSYFEKRQIWDILMAHMDHPVVKAFLDEFVECSAEHYSFILRQSRKEPPDRFALHHFVHMQADAMLTLFSQNMTREEMLHNSKIVIKMLRGAFYALLSE